MQMEEYIVSALKYRPLNFDSVIGQRALTTTLKNAISSGKLAHAYLFCGPRGVGKTTCARIFAKAINCLDPQEGAEPCGRCESCQAFDQQRSMNIHELDAASNNSVEDIRELCKQVLIPPQTGRYKVFIIDEVHMLSPSAFNAFLKTLEEPPSYVIFILCTTEKHKILPTILSRCQVYDFQRMTTKDTIDHLMYVAAKEGYTAEPEALALIAEKADGGMRDALSIFDQMVSFSGGSVTYDNVCRNLNVLNQEYYFRLVDLFLAGRVPDCLLLLAEVLQKGFDGGNFIGGLATHMRNLLVSRDAVTLPLLEMSDRMRARYQEQALRCPIHFVYKVLKLTNDCDQAYRTSRNKRLQVELCLIQAATTAETASSQGNQGGLTAQGSQKAQDTQGNQAAQGSQNTLNTLNSQSTPKAPAAQVIQDSGIPPKAPAPQKPLETSGEPPSRPLPKISFKHFGAGKKDEEPASKPLTTPSEVLGKEPINDERLVSAWYTFIESLPHDSVALAGRLKGLQPRVMDDNTAELKVSNPQVQQTVENLMPQILSTMRRELRNSTFTLKTQLEEMQEIIKSVNPSEMLREMNRQNPEVGELVNRLQLTFD